jgi:hypothetical protein
MKVSLARNYILDENNRPVVCENILEWSRWMENNKFIKQTKTDSYFVSTVFLGIDHNWSGKGPPVLFECMIFADDDWVDLACQRYCTYDEALEDHPRMILEAKRLMMERALR